jgi:hypothetical protein
MLPRPPQTEHFLCGPGGDRATAGNFSIYYADRFHIAHFDTSQSIPHLFAFAAGNSESSSGPSPRNAPVRLMELAIGISAAYLSVLAQKEAAPMLKTASLSHVAIVR